jgi:hypothetical protein
VLRSYVYDSSVLLPILITLLFSQNSDWCEPIDDSEEAKWCASRRLDQALGWYADPICEELFTNALRFC